MEGSEEFHEGDVVVLNSGGPRMTVVAVTAEKVLTATWYDSDIGIMHREDLPSKAVQRAY